jgi:hypothetical protein
LYVGDSTGVGAKNLLAGKGCKEKKEHEGWGQTDLSYNENVIIKVNCV